jgi:hypothetical protein
MTDFDVERIRDIAIATVIGIVISQVFDATGVTDSINEKIQKAISTTEA